MRSLAHLALHNTLSLANDNGVFDRLLAMRPKDFRKPPSTAGPVEGAAGRRSGVAPKSIGQIGAGKIKPTGVIDVGILQSLNRKGEVSDLVAGYGQVIVDECHHVSAFSFERVLKQVRARYVVGLTATPVRKPEGHCLPDSGERRRARNPKHPGGLRRSPGR